MDVTCELIDRAVFVGLKKIQIMSFIRNFLDYPPILWKNKQLITEDLPNKWVL